MVLKKYLLILILLMVPLFVTSQFFDNSFPIEPEIETKILSEKGIILFNFSLDENNHITDLKNNFFKIELSENEFVSIKDVIFPQGVPFGDELVFKGKFSVQVLLSALKEISIPLKLEFTVGYQICQERPREICFQPESKKLTVEILESLKLTGKITDTDSVIKDSIKKQDNIVDDESLSERIEKLFFKLLKNRSMVLLFLVIFLAGFMTSLTPCVYPIIPIVMGYIGSRSGKKKLKGFYLSVLFVLGLAFVYAILGVVAGLTGSIIGISFQNPIIILIISAIFVIMGLSLAGLFNIPVPSFISAKVQYAYKNEIIGSLIIGGISGIIAAPCVGPILIALLTWISQTRNIFLGFFLTFTFSLGLGIIFILVGTFSGIISSLPKGGKWMEYIKYFFAILLIVSGIFILNTITDTWLMFMIWGVFLIALSVFIGLFSPIRDDFKSKIYKILVILIFLFGVFMFFKGLEIHYFPAKKDETISVSEKISWLSNLEEGRERARNENKLLMIDTYADWCIPCHELEEYTFSNPVVTEILNNFVLVKLDFTKSSERLSSLRRSLNIYGMPTVIFENSEGQELYRFSGFKNKDDFLEIINPLIANPDSKQ